MSTCELLELVREGKEAGTKNKQPESVESKTKQEAEAAGAFN
jgi:hypothetical protein